MKQIILKLNELRGGKNTFQVSSTAKELELEDIDYPIVGNIDTDIEVYKNRNNYEIKLKTRFTFHLTCSRCLTEFEKEFEDRGAFYLKKGEIPDIPEGMIKDEHIETLYVSGDEYDLAPIIREQVLLSIPMKPLCSDSCTVPSYDSGMDEVDSRWADLIKLKEKLL